MFLKKPPTISKQDLGERVRRLELLLLSFKEGEKGSGASFSAKSLVAYTFDKHSCIRRLREKATETQQHGKSFREMQLASQV